MNKDLKMKAIEICMKHRATIEFLPVIEHHVCDQYLGMTYGCPAVIEDLVNNGYMLSMDKGHIIIDKLNF